MLDKEVLEKIRFSWKLNEALRSVNQLLKEYSDAGIEVADIFVRRNDPQTGKAPILCINVFPNHALPDIAASTKTISIMS